jgi:DNA-binding response OmpR family regulator
LAAVYPEPIDLVITDVVMPELGGTELAERLRRTRPEVVVLFMSGYTEDELVRRGVADGRMLLLEKPFSPATLNRRVREALARGA